VLDSFSFWSVFYCSGWVASFNSWHLRPLILTRMIFERKGSKILSGHTRIGLLNPTTSVHRQSGSRDMFGQLGRLAEIKKVGLRKTLTLFEAILIFMP
jgi:hypothetical protein